MKSFSFSKIDPNARIRVLPIEDKPLTFPIFRVMVPWIHGSQCNEIREWFRDEGMQGWVIASVDDNQNPCWLITVMTETNAVLAKLRWCEG